MEEYRNEAGHLHREDGPARTWPDGTQEWYIKGRLHREGEPAFIWPDGSLEWWVNNKRHRENGPAYISASGSQHWYINSKRRREDGLPYILNKTYNTMTLSNGEVVPMSADDYEKYQYKPTGRFTKAALREN